MFRSLAISVLLIGACTAWGQEKPTVIPPPAAGEAHASGISEKADLAGGCYWGTQGVFEHVKGIKRVVAGFSGGHSDDDGGAEKARDAPERNIVTLDRLAFEPTRQHERRNRRQEPVGENQRGETERQRQAGAKDDARDRAE